MKKIAFALVALAAIFGLSAAAGAAGTYPPVLPDVVVSTPSPLPGGTVVLGITGCEPGAVIEINNAGTSITVTADASGAATVPTTAPSTPGPYIITVTCGGATTTLNLNVLPAGPPTNGGTNGGGTTGGLPATGSGGTNTTLMLGLGALVVGGGLFGVSQIRRRQTLSA
jgi:LPXTG-motif cell wall-anchored protein